MAHLRRGKLANQDRGRGRGQARGRGALGRKIGIANWTESSNRTWTQLRGARVSNECERLRSRAFVPNIGNIPRRACNNHPLPVYENIINPPIPIVVHLDAIELACTMTTTLTKSETYRKPRDIIVHAKKCGAYDFYCGLNLGQANKWIKTVKKAFNIL